ncbi:MAG: fumarylacetoacetate hydrolase family protein [Prevotellaceae bacterium]|jgi:2-keto-4-pentenoate hydratase/2-oxohepta-3-ene-1,7-dioic acid hydratase in catechol pathway|nr:fumarylacetoacetate hydrolase family protein [Prevotellaceae bacterium]
MKIICTGLNYVRHIEEFSNPVPENPVFFLKPETALLRKNRPFFYPDFSKNIHYEAELVLKIGKTGKSISEKFASRYIDSVGLGVDFTARDIQEKCRKNGLPWEICKSFDCSAPISSTFIPFDDFDSGAGIDFHLDINGKTVQNGNSTDLLFSFAKIISYVSQFITLKIGDLIFTGTPEGVGAVKIGDRLKGYIGQKLMLNFEVR